MANDNKFLRELSAAWAAFKPKAVAAIKDALRGYPLLVFFLLTFTVTALMAPAKVGLTLYGLSKIAAGLFMGYWGDRTIFPYARPHKLQGIEAGTSWKRRAIIVAACVVAAALIP